LDSSASCGGLTLPFASGIIDDLIVKAKVFGTSVGQFLLSFFENFRVTRRSGCGGSLIERKLAKMPALIWSDEN
jgi:hypothetical protein